MLFLIVLHSPHPGTAAFSPITAILEKKLFNYLNSALSNKSQINLALQLTHPARKRTPTAELHNTDPQVLKAKFELIVTMTSKAIPNTNETEEILRRTEHFYYSEVAPNTKRGLTLLICASSPPFQESDQSSKST